MDAQQRFEFFEFVGDQWGRDRAGQLMELLPSVPSDELVTRQHLSQELAIMRAELRQEMAELGNRLLERMNDQTRTIVIAMVTLWISGMALAFTAARLAG